MTSSTEAKGKSELALRSSPVDGPSDVFFLEKKNDAGIETFSPNEKKYKNKKCDHRRISVFVCLFVCLFFFQFFSSKAGSRSQSEFSERSQRLCYSVDCADQSFFFGEKKTFFFLTIENPNQAIIERKPGGFFLMSPMLP